MGVRLLSCRFPRVAVRAHFRGGKAKFPTAYSVGTVIALSGDMAINTPLEISNSSLANERPVCKIACGNSVQFDIRRLYGKKTNSGSHLYTILPISSFQIIQTYSYLWYLRKLPKVHQSRMHHVHDSSKEHPMNNVTNNDNGNIGATHTKREQIFLSFSLTTYSYNFLICRKGWQYIMIR